MDRFFGRYEHTLDGKGRVILPAKFRGPFVVGAFLTQHLDGCLALWTPTEFAIQGERMQEQAALGRQQRNLARMWASASQEVDIDRQGRMAIPAHLRQYAGLQGDVLVLGANDRVELWDPARWEEIVGPEAQRLSEGMDL